MVAWVDYFNHLTLSVTSGHSVISNGCSTVQGFEMKCLCLALFRLTDTPWEVMETPVGHKGSSRFRT